MNLPPGAAAALEAQTLLGAEVTVVAAFQNVSAVKLKKLDQAVDCDVFVCADDRASREAVIELVAAAGMRGLDAGGLQNAVAAESLTPLLLHLNKTYGVQGAGIRITRPGRWRMTRAPKLAAYAIPGIPLIQAGDDIIGIILDKAEAARIQPRADDVLVISSKIVSKSLGRLVALERVDPSAEARALAEETGKDPRLVELILRQSRRVSRKRLGVLVTEHHLGLVSANAGVDQSNIEAGDNMALLLPLDPDGAADEFRADLRRRLGIDVAVVISDTHGRPFRVGNVGVAIGASGLPAVRDLRGQQDLYGRVLEVTQVAFADLVASAAHLLCGEADEGLPAVLLRGLDLGAPHGPAADLNRAAEHDLYR